MPFETGTPKPPNSGVKKGYKTPRKTVEELLAKHGVDLWERFSEILDVLEEKSPRHAMEAVLKMFEYVRPKLSTQDINITAEVGPTRVAVERDLVNRLLCNPEALQALRALEAAAPMLSGPPASVIPSPDVNDANGVPNAHSEDEPSGEN